MAQGRAVIDGPSLSNTNATTLMIRVVSHGLQPKQSDNRSLETQAATQHVKSADASQVRPCLAGTTCWRPAAQQPNAPWGSCTAQPGRRNLPPVAPVQVPFANKSTPLVGPTASKKLSTTRPHQHMVSFHHTAVAGMHRADQATPAAFQHTATPTVPHCIPAGTQLPAATGNKMPVEKSN